MAINTTYDKVSSIEVVKTELGEPDSNGRRRPQPIEGSEYALECDAVVMAFGFKPDPKSWLTDLGVQTDERGRFKSHEQVDFSYQ